FCAIIVAFFFFFQAEDGIRDSSVTGVQTCALPISAAPAFWSRSSSPRPTTERTGVAQPSTANDSSGPSSRRERGDPLTHRLVGRSEERRVGKEWRSRRGEGP